MYLFNILLKITTTYVNPANNNRLGIAWQEKWMDKKGERKFRKPG